MASCAKLSNYEALERIFSDYWRRSFSVPSIPWLSKVEQTLCTICADAQTHLHKTTNVSSINRQINHTSGELDSQDFRNGHWPHTYTASHSLPPAFQLFQGRYIEPRFLWGLLRRLLLRTSTYYTCLSILPSRYRSTYYSVDGYSVELWTLPTYHLGQITQWDHAHEAQSGIPPSANWINVSWRSGEERSGAVTLSHG